MPCRHTLIIVTAMLCLAGCASAPQLGGADNDRSFEEQQLAAAAAIADKDPAAALAFLYPVATLNPDDAELGARIEALEAKIDSRVALAISRGKAAYKRGDRRAGDASMMQALALEPGLEEALEALRRSASEVSHDRQAEKVAYEFTEREMAEEQQALVRIEKAMSEGDYDLVLALSESQSLEDVAAVRSMTLMAHLGLAGRAKVVKNYDAELRHIGAAIALSDGEDKQLLARERELRDQLSEEAYRVGLSLMQTDLAEAIVQLERAVDYTPDNLAAKQKLDQAKTLKKNLDRIRGS